MMKRKKLIFLLTAMAVGMTGCAKSTHPFNNEVKKASGHTTASNDSYYDKLDFSDTQEEEFATRGLIDAPKKLELWDEKHEQVVWSQTAYAFLEEKEKAANTVNPSLWQNSLNNHAYGLFEVSEGIYQVRGYDMANLTLIESKTGWIVFDPLMSVECSKAAMELVEKNLGERPIAAVVISHPHIDHYGGIKGIMTAEQAADPSLPLEEQIASGKIPIIVPQGFTEHAVSENVYAGPAMSRRASYQYGVYLPPAKTGKVAMGIGMGQSLGNTSFLLPSYEVKKTGETLLIDGIAMEFQMTPGTEAPAEMNTYFPDKKALWVAENCTGTLHNLYTLRGAQVRDGNAWAKYITETAAMYGKEAEVTFQSHNWPHWGNKVIQTYLENTALVYKFINDKTLQYINQGYTSDEISNQITLPKSLEKVWSTRQYYGTVAHNSKAVYQKYMGWYDANPVNLNPLEPTERAKKWVEYLGDTDQVLEKASEDFEKGEYRWVAEITNVLVYNDPANEKARQLCADALEQLGYQSESGTWRNAYLTGALELRQGNAAKNSPNEQSGREMMANMTASMLLDYMGILIDKEASAEVDYTINITLKDTNETFLLRWSGGILLPYADTLSEKPDVSLTCTKMELFALIRGSGDDIYAAMNIEGDKQIIEELSKCLKSDPPDKEFNIIEP